MGNRKEIFSRVRRIVVKVGSAVVADEKGLSRAVVENLAAEISRFQRQGYEMILVSSGAIACGRRKLEVPERPLSLAEKQALAAAGQSSLMQAYEEAFGRYGIPVAQILLTREDLEDRKRYLNARNTLRVLLRWKVVPIVNENDTVAVEEIQLGDNDFLAALVVALTEADLLICLSEAEALYERDPREDPAARPVREVRGITPEVEAMAGRRPGRFGRGGMLSKLRAARMVNSLGVPMILAPGRTPLILERLFSGEEIGTIFWPSARRLSARKFWIAHGTKPEGRLVLDAGAVAALREKGKSLLPAGVRAVEGDFERGACVECVDEEGRPVALGLTNYSSRELRCILGVHTCEIEERLGFRGPEEIIHRDDLVLLEN